MRKSILTAIGACLLLVVLLPGCKKGPPPLVEVEGLVLLNGQPLPQAQVEFVPDLEDFGAQLNSTGVTDEQGHFSLTCMLHNQPGAVVGKHRVLVTDPPLSRELRGADGESQAKYAKFFASLKNRPIPEKYTTVGRTDLVVEITPDQKNIELKLTR